MLLDGLNIVLRKLDGQLDNLVQRSRLFELVADDFEGRTRMERRSFQDVFEERLTDTHSLQP